MSSVIVKLSLSLMRFNTCNAHGHDFECLLDMPFQGFHNVDTWQLRLFFLWQSTALREKIFCIMHTDKPYQIKRRSIS